MGAGFVVADRISKVRVTKKGRAFLWESAAGGEKPD